MVPRISLQNRAYLRQIIGHEAQHIRNLDTSFIYLLFFLRNTFFINPAVHSLFNNLRSLHELHVDQEIALKRPQQKCLYLKTMAWVFESIQLNAYPQLTNGFFGKSRIKEYKMRINNIKNARKQNINFLSVLFFMGLCGLSVACASRYYNENLAVKSLPAKKERKVAYQVAFNIRENGKVMSSPRVISEDGETAAIIMANDPEFIRDQESTELELDIKKYKEALKLEVIASGAEEGYVQMDIKGLISNNSGIKEIHIKDKFKMGELIRTDGLDADMKVTKL